MIKWFQQRKEKADLKRRKVERAEAEKLEDSRDKKEEERKKSTKVDSNCIAMLHAQNFCMSTIFFLLQEVKIAKRKKAEYRKIQQAVTPDVQV